MKYTFLILLISLLCLSSVFNHRIRKNSLRHRHRYQGPTNNILYQFLLGMIAEFSGEAGWIDNCSKQVPGWESAGDSENGNADKKKDGSMEKDLAGNQSTFKKILGYLGTAINVVCTVKDKIISFFTKSRRRYSRLFTEGKLRTRWPFEDFFSKVGNAFADAGNAIVSGAKKVKNAVVDGVDWAKKKASEIAEFIKNKCKEIFQPVLDLWDDIKKKFTEWLSKHPMMEKVFNFLNCFITNKGLQGMKGLYDSIKNLLALIPILGTPAGWVTLVVNLICGWEDLKAGIEFCAQGIKESDRPKKYNYFGKFFGRIVKAIAG